MATAPFCTKFAPQLGTGVYGDIALVAPFPVRLLQTFLAVLGAGNVRPCPFSGIRRAAPMSHPLRAVKSARNTIRRKTLEPERNRVTTEPFVVKTTKARRREIPRRFLFPIAPLPWRLQVARVRRLMSRTGGQEGFCQTVRPSCRACPSFSALWNNTVTGTTSFRPAKGIEAQHP